MHSADAIVFCQMWFTFVYLYHFSPPFLFTAAMFVFTALLWQSQYVCHPYCQCHSKYCNWWIHVKCSQKCDCVQQMPFRCNQSTPRSHAEFCWIKGVEKFLHILRRHTWTVTDWKKTSWQKNSWHYFKNIWNKC